MNQIPASASSLLFPTPSLTALMEPSTMRPPPDDERGPAWSDRFTVSAADTDLF